MLRLGGGRERGLGRGPAGEAEVGEGEVGPSSARRAGLCRQGLQACLPLAELLHRLRLGCHRACLAPRHAGWTPMAPPTAKRLRWAPSPSRSVPSGRSGCTAAAAVGEAAARGLRRLPQELAGGDSPLPRPPETPSHAARSPAHPLRAPPSLPRRSRGAAAVFAASDRPTVIYSSNRKLLYSNLNENEVWLAGCLGRGRLGVRSEA